MWLIIIYLQLRELINVNMFTYSVIKTVKEETMLTLLNSNKNTSVGKLT